MTKTINAKQLREQLGEIVSEVRQGSRFTVLYRSRPAFDIVPIGESNLGTGELESDSLFGAEPVGASSSGDAARNHDAVLYG